MKGNVFIKTKLCAALCRCSIWSARKWGEWGRGLMSTPKFLTQLLALILHSVLPLCPDCNPHFLVPHGTWGYCTHNLCGSRGTGSSATSKFLTTVSISDSISRIYLPLSVASFSAPSWDRQAILLTASLFDLPKSLRGLYLNIRVSLCCWDQLHCQCMLHLSNSLSNRWIFNDLQ